VGAVGAGGCGTNQYALKGHYFDAMRTTYHITSRYKNLALTANILLSLAILGIAAYFSVAGCIFTFLLVIEVFNFFITLRTLEQESITITDKTIEYQKLGSRFEVHWNDIERISRLWYARYGIKQDCLVFNKSKVRTLDMYFLGSLYSVRILNPQEAFIPLSPFADIWRDSDLGQQIKQYAPHLFVHDAEIS
jgi:hypothetical protein